VQSKTDEGAVNLRTVRPRNCGSIPDTDNIIFFPNCSDWLWSPCELLAAVCERSAGSIPTSRSRVVSEWSWTSLPLHVFMVWTDSNTKKQLTYLQVKFCFYPLHTILCELQWLLFRIIHTVSTTFAKTATRQASTHYKLFNKSETSVSM